jgi:hypothetical protein
MSVEFNEPAIVPAVAAKAKQASFFTRMVIKTGLVKTEREAQWVLLFVAIIAAVLAVAFVPFATQKPPAPPLEMPR